MSELDVACAADADGWRCTVTVSDDDGSETQHTVSVSPAEQQRYGGGTAGVQALVDASFRFLLERESKESILRRFALADIERYFPEFPRVIGSRLQR
jgi:hypothetical protein